jgi:hypothetical protein
MTVGVIEDELESQSCEVQGEIRSPGAPETGKERGPERLMVQIRVSILASHADAPHVTGVYNAIPYGFRSGSSMCFLQYKSLSDST